MKKFNLLLLLGLFVLSNQVLAQVDVAGNVKSKDGEPVLAAVVALLQSPNNKFIKAAVTRDDGTFIINML